MSFECISNTLNWRRILGKKIIIIRWCFLFIFHISDTKSVWCAFNALLIHFFLTQFIKIWICISFSGAGNNGTLEHNSMQAVGMMDLGQGSTDPVELRRLNFQTPGKLKNLWFFQSKNLELGIFFKYLFKVWCPTPLFQSWT